MSTLLAFLKNSRFHTLLVIALMSLVIWYYGPLVTVGHLHPLATPMHRLVALLSLAIIWGFTNLLPDVDLAKRSTLIEQVNNDIKIMENNLAIAMKKIKYTRLARFFGFNNTQWNLVIGPKNSGKSTLLQSAQSLISSKAGTPTSITHTHLCDYWFFPNTVFMSLVGNLFDTENSKEYHNTILHQFLNLMARNRIHFNHVIIALPLQEMLSESDTLQQRCENIRQFLQQLQLKSPQMHVTIMITKCDRIAGFNEFFANRNDEEREQACGIDFGKAPYDKPITELFNEKFDEFVNKLNNQVIARLHDEHQLSTRQLIKDFPTQLDILKVILAQALNEILPSTDISLRSIYLTSSITTNSPINNLLPAMQEVFELPSHEKRPLKPIEQKKYFIVDAFKQLIENTNSPSRRYNRQQVMLMSLFSLLITAACVSVGYRHYQANFAHFASAKSAIDSAINGQDTQILEQLHALETTILALHENNSQQLGNEKALIQTAYNAFWQIIHQKLLPEYLEQVSDQIVTLTAQNEQTDYFALYDALKTYLMLTNPQHLDLNHVEDWYKQYWSHSVPQLKTRTALFRYLQIALTRKLPELPTNAMLVQQAREVLSHNSPSKLGMRLIHNQNYGAKIKLVKKNPELILEPSHNELPAMYSQILFYDIYHNQIPHVARRISKGIWVFSDSPDSQMNLAELTSSMQKTYLQHYLEQWQQVLQGVQYHKVSNSRQLSHLLSNISSEQSPVKQLLNMIKFNTNNLLNETEFNKTVATEFVAINLIEWNKSSQLTEALQKLTQVFEQINTDKDPMVAAFTMAKARMENPHQGDAFNHLFSEATTLPHPFSNYVNSLANNAWSVVLADSKQYMNVIWNNFILPEYNQNIKNHYPIFGWAHSEISLTNFTRFFAPNGVLAMFFDNYLSAFIDKHDYHWTWKSVNGQTANLSQDCLDMFMRKTLIEKMFFSTQANQPTIKFTLTGLAMNPDIKTFNLMLNGQAINYEPEQTQVFPISWPGPQDDGVSLSYTTKEGKASSLTFNGTWGWFRLLDKSKLEPGGQQNSLKVKFEYDNHTLAKYNLSVESLINPFTPDILNRFRCPENLG